MSDFNRKFAIFQFKSNAKKRIRVWRRIQSMLKNGVPILEAIDEMGRRATTKGKTHPDAIMLNEWRSEIRKGRRLSDAVIDWIPQSEYMIISASDQSGRLVAGFDSAIEVTTASKNIRSAIIGGLAYPIVLLILAIAVLWLFGTMIVPKFSQIAGDESKWTGLAAAVVKLSHFTQDYLIFLVIGVAAFIATIVWSLSRWDGPLRVRADVIPPYSIYRMVSGAAWLISLSALIKSGVRLESALKELSSNSGKWMKNRTAAALGGLRSGDTLGIALSKSGYNFPDKEVIDDLIVYSRLSGFDEALSILGKEWINEGVERIKTQMNFLFSISILCVASIIAVEASGLFAMQSQLQVIIRTK